MYIRNAIESRLSETLELYEMERANPKFPMLTHEYFYGKCMGILDVALSLGMDEDELGELYEPYRLRLLSLKREDAEYPPEEYDLAGLESISISEIEQYDLHLETWGDDGDWHGTLFGEDICTEHFTGKTENEVLDKAEAAVNRILEQWREWDEDLDDVDEVLEWLRAEVEDHEFEAARERRYGYDD